MKLHVGDFVRWSVPIVKEHGHIALTSERGVVVSVDPDAKAVFVVWPDGERCRHPINVLTRDDGKNKMGHIARSIGEKKIPVKDRGHKPVVAPPRTIPTPLPGPSPDQYKTEALTVRWFVTIFDKTKQKDISIPMEMYKVHVKCLRSGRVWAYTGTKRKGKVTWGDSRVQEKRMGPADFMDEIKKYAEPGRVFGGIAEVKIGPAEYRAIYPGA